MAFFAMIGVLNKRAAVENLFFNRVIHGLETLLFSVYFNENSDLSGFLLAIWPK